MNDDYSKANGNKLSTVYLVTILNDLNGSYLSPFLVGMCTIYDKKFFFVHESFISSISWGIFFLKTNHEKTKRLQIKFNSLKVTWTY